MSQLRRTRRGGSTSRPRGDYEEPEEGGIRRGPGKELDVYGIIHRGRQTLLLLDLQRVAEHFDALPAPSWWIAKPHTLLEACLGRTSEFGTARAYGTESRLRYVDECGAEREGACCKGRRRGR